MRVRPTLAEWCVVTVATCLGAERAAGRDGGDDSRDCSRQRSGAEDRQPTNPADPGEGSLTASLGSDAIWSSSG